ncbi:MAG: hypothetical protein ABW166_04930 [Sedimenticola sp.]
MKRKTTRRRRNPVTASGIVGNQLMPAATNAMGALALDIVWSYLPVPMNIKTGAFKHIAKGIGAIAIGSLAGNFINKRTARAMSQGALTVVMHDAMREVTQQMLPNVPLSYYSPGMPAGVGEYTQGLGAYTSGGSTASPYLAADTLAKPFYGPSAATVATEACLESEGNMGCYY